MDGAVPQWEFRVWALYEAAGSGLVAYVDGVEVDYEQRLPLSSALAQAGADGWELVSTHSHENGWATYVFKRPKRLLFG
jgi:hypothetical protein